MAFVSEKETICYKLDQCQDALQGLVRTGEMDVLAVLRQLELIRKDATRMEHSIRTNKALRLKHGIDAEYRKMMNEAESPEGIEKNVPEVREQKAGEVDYHIRVVDNVTKKEVFNGNSHAFILVIVNKIKDIDLAGIIDGEAQVFAVGHDIALWFAFDQWKQRMRSKMVEIEMGFAEAIANHRFGNKEWKEKMLKFLNK